MGGGLRKAGFTGFGGVELSFSGFCLSVPVEESCVLDVKSGTVLLISSGRVLVFNCS